MVPFLLHFLVMYDLLPFPFVGHLDGCYCLDYSFHLFIAQTLNASSARGTWLSPGESVGSRARARSSSRADVSVGDTC